MPEPGHMAFLKGLPAALDTCLVNIVLPERIRRFLGDRQGRFCANYSDSPLGGMKKLAFIIRIA